MAARRRQRKSNTRNRGSRSLVKKNSDGRSRNENTKNQRLRDALRRSVQRKSAKKLVPCGANVNRRSPVVNKSAGSDFVAEQRSPKR